MIYFATENIKSKKTISSVFLFLLFSVGLFYAYSNRNSFVNFKTYYIRSYSYIALYKLKEVSNSWPFNNTIKSQAASDSKFTKSVPVLLYHGVLGGSAGNPEGEATNISLENFWDQMKTLKDAGWKTITMDDFKQFVEGQKKLPPKSFLLTFDDGRKDSYYPSTPILKALDFHAVMFAIEKYSVEEKSNYYLSKDELKKMEESPNWEVESHGYSSHSEYPINSNGEKGHFYSNKIWLPEMERVETDEEYVARVTEDLMISKTRFQDLFGKEIVAFAFPFGDYGGASINFPKSESYLVPIVTKIYPLAFYQYSGIYRYSQNYQNKINSGTGQMIRRISINPSWNGQDLLKTFEKGTEKKIPFIAKFAEEDGWVNTNWGTLVLGDRKMTMESTPNGTGSTVVLDGSNALTDYTVTAEGEWLKGSNIYLSARYKDDNNLVSCNFSNKLVHIEEVVNGKSRVAAGVENKFDPGGLPFTFSISVKGRTAECKINGQVIVSNQYISPTLDSGGVGIKIWDSVPGNSKLIIDKFTIDPL